MAITDFVTFFLSIYFLARGSSRGFMHSLLVPFSMIMATVLSIIYYQFTKNVTISLLIGLIGPFLLSLLLKFLLKTWARATDTEIKPNFLSRLGGAILTLAWGWVFIILTLILFAILPTWGETLTAVHHDVMKSSSYKLIKPWTALFLPVPSQNVAAVATVTSGSDTQSLALDPRFQQVLQDPEIQKDIDAHDIMKLMSNPKMMELTRQIMNDPATMKKVMAIYRSQTQPVLKPDTPHSSQENKNP